MKTNQIVWILAAAAFAWYLWQSFNAAKSRLPAQEAREMYEKGAQLVDVRSPGEFNGGHIEGAVNIPLSDLNKRMSEIDKNKPVIVYCRSGNRSGRAQIILKKSGFDAHNGGGFGHLNQAF